MILPKTFEKRIHKPENLTQKSLWFIFKRDQLLVKTTGKDKTVIPAFTTPREINLAPIRERYLGSFGNHHCSSAEIEQTPTLPPQLEFRNFRQIYGTMDNQLYFIAGYAFQIMKWEQASVHCGRCGNPMHHSDTEQVKICPQCHLHKYPALTPAVIVAIVNDNKILLGRARHFPPGVYSVLAGFVEPGENLESCVHREIKEEVNIEVKNLRYFGSQFWPFSESLMIGFTAEYKAGEILVNKNELEDARWFLPHEIPSFPDDLSISRKLINWFSANDPSGMIKKPDGFKNPQIKKF